MPAENTFDRPIIPANERERLAALARYEQVRDLPDGAFNHIAQMAVRLFDVPIAVVNLVGAEVVRTIAGEGELAVGTEIVRGVSLCSLAVLSDEPTVFENALEEPCLLMNPLVTGSFGLGFYAAAPLRTPDGFNIGAVCLVDKQPRVFTAGEQKVLEGLAQIVMEDMEARFPPSSRQVAAAPAQGASDAR